MVDEQRGSQLFSEAIKSLEDGDNDRAEQLFIGALSNLDKKHHSAIISLKSLVTISSNKGDFEKAIEWSLKLLESQTGAMGHTHADVSRTVMNIATMCETLGKHDLAKEVKDLHQYASQAERSHRAQQVKTLRSTGKQTEQAEEPGEDDYDEERATIHTYMQKQAQSWQEKLQQASGPLVTAMCLGVIAVSLITFVALKFLYSSAPGARLAKQKVIYRSSDNRIAVDFQTPSVISISLDDKEFRFPFKAYGYSGIELGDLMISSPFEKEYWLMLTSEGLADSDGRVYVHPDHVDRDILSQMTAIQESAVYYYKKNNHVYPDSTETLGDFSYKNPYTLRKDYPLIQIVDVPGNSNPEAFLKNLLAGGLWPGEPALYPGCINICHMSSRRNTAVKDTLIVHGCNRSSAFFRQSNGKPYLIVLKEGAQVEPSQSSLNFLKGVGRVSILDIHPAFAGMVLMLIKGRYILYCGILSMFFLFISSKFEEIDTTKKVTGTLGIVLMIAAIGFAILGWFL